MSDKKNPSVKIEDLPEISNNADEKFADVKGGADPEAGFENPIISFENPIISFENPIISSPTSSKGGVKGK